MSLELTQLRLREDAFIANVIGDTNKKEHMNGLLGYQMRYRDQRKTRGSALEANKEIENNPGCIMRIQRFSAAEVRG